MELHNIELEAIHQTMWRLELRWKPETPDAHMHHAYERLPPIDFFPLIRRAGDPNGRTLMDIGCGIGTNLLMAFVMGWNVVGVDRHLPYLEVARALVPEARLIHSDAFDLTSFDADVIYVYRPMVSGDDQRRLESHIASRMRPGSIMLSTGSL